MAMVVPDTVKGTEARLLIVTAEPALKETIAEVSPLTLIIEPPDTETIAPGEIDIIAPLETVTAEPRPKAGNEVILISPLLIDTDAEVKPETLIILPALMETIADVKPDTLIEVPAEIDTIAAPNGGNEVIAIVVPDTVSAVVAKLLMVIALPADIDTIAAPKGGKEVMAIAGDDIGNGLTADTGVAVPSAPNSNFTYWCCAPPTWSVAIVSPVPLVIVTLSAINYSYNVILLIPPVVFADS